MENEIFLPHCLNSLFSLSNSLLLQPHGTLRPPATQQLPPAARAGRNGRFPLGSPDRGPLCFSPFGQWLNGAAAHSCFRCKGNASFLFLLSTCVYFTPPYGIKGTNFLTNWHARKPPKRASEAGFVPFLRRLSALRLMSVRSPRPARRAAEGRRFPPVSPGLPPDCPPAGPPRSARPSRAVLKRWKPAACERAEKHCGAGKKRPQRKIFFSADEIRFLCGASPSAPQCFSAASPYWRKPLGTSGLKNSENAAAATVKADSQRRGFLEARGAGVLREFA